MRETIPSPVQLAFADKKKRYAAVGRSFDSPVKFSPQKPRVPIVPESSPLLADSKLTPEQLYRRRCQQIRAEYDRRVDELAEKLDDEDSNLTDDPSRPFIDFKEVAQKMLGKPVYPPPPRGVEPFLPGGPSRVPLGESRGKGYGDVMFHTREYEGRGRLGFMNDLPGSTRGW
jgi:hypothetical protein